MPLARPTDRLTESGAVGLNITQTSRPAPDYTDSSLVNRVQFLLLGAPNRVAALHTQPVREGLAARLRWTVFGPRNKPTIPPTRRGTLRPPPAMAYNDRDPSIYGNLGQPASLRGMAELFSEGLTQMPDQIYPVSSPAVMQTDLQPYTFDRAMWPLYDKWHHLRPDSNTEAGWDPRTGAGQGAFTPTTPNMTVDPTVKPAGTQMRQPLTIKQAALRVPRYSTAPNTIVPRGSP